MVDDGCAETGNRRCLWHRCTGQCRHGGCSGWFCACRTQGTTKDAPVIAYVEVLKAELAMLAAILPKGVQLSRLHWGGGTPTLLSPALMTELAQAIADVAPFAEDYEFSVEIDPNEIDEARCDALAAAGMNRASIGVQDFDEQIQQSIGRLQSFEITRDAAEMIRAGIQAVSGGQVEASATLGMSRSQTLRRIVLPQALRIVIPPIGNDTISMLKFTSLVSVLALPDLLFSAQMVYARTYQTIPLLMVATIWYLVLTTVLTFAEHAIEHRLSEGSPPSKRSFQKRLFDMRPFRRQKEFSA